MAGREKIERERFWRGVIRDQRASGLSISAFCRDRQVSPGSFFNWRRTLAERQRENGSNHEDKTTGEETTAKFVAVELPSASPTAAGAGCEIVLADGCRIIVPRQCDASWLREIIEALEARAC